MAKLAEYERYMKYLCEALGHQDRHAGFADYSRGLMLPIERKSVEPLAAHTDPLHVSSQHQSLHHVVAMSEWSDTPLIERRLTPYHSRLTVFSRRRVELDDFQDHLCRHV